MSTICKALFDEVSIGKTQEIGSARSAPADLHHRRMNIEETTGTCYTDCITIVIYRTIRR